MFESPKRHQPFRRELPRNLPSVDKLRSAAWVWFLYTLFFAHAFLGRYRVVFGLAIFFAFIALKTRGVRLEAFGPFAASVIIAQGAGASQHVVNALAIAFVALRAVYVYAYIADKPMLRSGVWTLAFGCVCALFVLPFFK